MSSAHEILDLSPVIPVVVVADAAVAVPLARALAAGGLRAIEVTLRSDAALDAIGAIARDVPEMTVGAGTILSSGDIDAASTAGAQFLVSPGAPPALAEALRACGLPALPGAATTTEVMRLRDLGFGCQKFFPAEPAGGVAALRSIAGPLPDVRFCPTGGISAASAPDYLALPNVGCVGGSWLAPAQRVAAADWAGITDLARQAAVLPR